MKKLWTFIFVGALLAAGSLAVSARAQGNIVYAAEFNQATNYFGTINLLNGNFTKVASIGSALINDVAYCPTNGVLYGISNSSVLVVFNLTNGTMSKVANLSASGLESLAFRYSDGALFAATESGLYTLNPANGTATLVGSYGTPQNLGTGQNIRFAQDGNLYLSNTSTNTDIYRVNLTNGAATWMGEAVGCPYLVLENSSSNMYGVFINLGTSGTTSPELVTFNLSSFVNGGTNANGSTNLIIPTLVGGGTNFPANFNFSGIFPQAVTNLTVPVVATGPTNQTTVVGNNVVFSTVASGTGPYFYIWSDNGTNISGQTNSSLTLSNVTTANAGTYSVVVGGASGTLTNSATLTVNKATANVTFNNLNQTYTGSAVPVTVTTIPSGLTVNMTYNGTTMVPTNAGSYTVIATINDSNYLGSATNTLVVGQATGSVALGNLNQIYTGSAVAATATTSPSGLAVNFLYNSSASAPTNAGSYTVVATINSQNYQGSATNTLVIGKATGSIVLGGLSQTYTGSAMPVTATTTPSGLAVNLTYNGSSAAPTAVGSYTVVATINDLNYQGSATNKLVIGQAAGSIVLGSLNQTYTGSAVPATATTTPSGLAVNFTYNGSASTPTNAGSYTVVGTINNPNYMGSATNTLVIKQATGSIALGNLSQTYTGSAVSATATTTPSGLAVNFTYNGSATAPTAAGSYAVVATINDPNYLGSATSTLVIEQATGSIVLGSLNQTYTGSAMVATATTTPSGLAVNLTYNGWGNPPTNAGSYTVIGTINDPNYQGSVTNTLVIGRAAGSIVLSNLDQIYTGSAVVATATTTPTGLGVNFEYNGSATAPTNAGSYTVIATINNGNYLGSATNTLVIEQANGSIALGNLSQTYTGSALPVTASTIPGDLEVNITYDGLTTVPTNAGSYTVIATIEDSNYLGSATNSLVIEQASGAVVLGSLNQAYTGSAVVATATTTPSGLVVDFTYNGSASAPTAAGSYTVVATINDTNYQGSATNTLVIGQATASIVLGSLNQTYTGSASPVTATTTPSGLAVNFSYNGSATAPTAAGSYTVVATINDPNYLGSATSTLVIGQATGSIVLSSLNQTYTGSALAATVSTTPSGLAVNLTYNGWGSPPTNAGSYTVIGTINDPNYQGSVTNTLVIGRAAGSIVLSNLDQIYTGSAVVASATTTPTGLGVNFEYNGSATAPTNAGSYTVEAMIHSRNYQGSATNTLVIEQATGSVALGNLNQTYTGSALPVTATTIPSDLDVNITYDGLTSVPTNAGSYTVIATIVDSNFVGSATNTLVIGQASGTVALGSLSQTYSGSAVAPTATTTPSGLAVNFTYNGSASAPTAAGNYTVVATINDPNYQGSATNTLVIGQATASIVLGSLSQTYTGTASPVTATTIPSGLTVNMTYNGSATAPTAAGSYTVIATINDPNYLGSATSTLVIGQATGSIVLSSLNQTYTGSALAATVSTTPSGLAVNLTYNGWGNPPTNAGSYTVIGTINDPNYQGSVTNTLVIGRAAGSIVLSNLDQIYTGSAVVATATTTPTGLGVNFEYNGSATAPTNAGSYTVVAAIHSRNYQSSATNTLVIEQANGSIALGNLSQTYTGSALPVTATTIPSDLEVNITYDGLTTVPSNAGSYTVIATIEESNYVGSTTNTLVIGQATGSVVLGNLSQTYTGSALAATASTSPNGLAVNLTYNGWNTPPTNAGSYTVIGTINDPNFLGSATNTLVIGRAAGSIVLSNLDQIYTGSAVVATATTTPTGLGVDFEYNGSATAPTNAGSYTVVGTIHSRNYQGSATNTLVVEQAAGSIALGNLNQTYTGSALPVTASTIPGDLDVNITYDGLTSMPTNAGSYTVIATIEDSNFVGSATNTLVIGQASGTVALGSLNQAYTGSAVVATATTTPSGLVVDFTYNGSASAPTAAGSYTVVATINDTNYQGSATNTLVIGQATASIVLGSLNQTYTGSALAAAISTTPSGLAVNLTYNGWGNPPTNAGSYTVIGTINDPNYQGSVTNTLVIGRAAGSIVLSNLDQIYTGSAVVATATTTPTGLGVNFEYNGSATAPTNAGSYTVVAFIHSRNYQGSATNTLVIEQANGSIALGNLSQTYTGSALPVTATTIPSDLEVNITYDGLTTVPSNAGSYTVIATIEESNYVGSTTNTLVIGQASGTVALGSLSQTYSGSAVAPTATTTPSGLAVNFTYNGSASAPTAAGSYTVVATINDPNYQGSATNTLVIGQATASIVLGSLSQTYTGSASPVTATTTPSGLVVNFSYNGSATAPTAAGSYTVIATINDPNYLGSATSTLVIGQATGSIVLSSLNQTYTGSALAAAISTTPSGLAVNLTYNGWGNPPTNAGSYTVIGTINDPNYQGSVTNTLVIGRAAGSIVLSNLDQIYTGSAVVATATTTPTGLGVNFEYNGSATAPTNAGSYTVIATINNGNYLGSATNTLVIEQANGSIALGNLSQTYTGSALPVTATTIPSDLEVNITYDGLTTVPTNAGSYTVIATIEDSNYLGSATNSLVIEQASGAVVLGSLNQAYTGSAVVATATTTPSGLVVDFTYNGSASAPTAAGSYTVVATINDPNYQGSATNTLVIGQATASIVLGSLSQTYTGTASPVTATTTPSGLAVNFSYNGSATAPTAAGSYTVVATINDPNYLGSATSTLVIGQGAGSVVLGNLSQTYTGSALAATASTSPNGLAVNLTYNGWNTPPTNAGSYTVIGTINDPNFLGSVTNTLTINTIPLTVTNLLAVDKVYDGRTNATLNTTAATVIGMVNSDVVSLVTSNATAYFADDDVATNKLVTVVNLELSGTAAANYRLVSPTNLTANITAAELTLAGVTVASKTYDSTTKAQLNGVVSLTGAVSKDDVSLNTNRVSAAFASANAGTDIPANVSGYTLTGTRAGNYSLTQPTGLTADITAATLTIFATANTKIYDGTTSAVAIPTTSGLQGSDSVTGLVETYDTKNAGTGKPLSVTAFTVNDGNSGKNYNITTVASTAGVITPAALTIAAAPNTKTYDGTTNAAAIPTVSGLQGSDSVTDLAEAYNNKNAGIGKTLIVSAYVINDGNLGGNYIVNTIPIINNNANNGVGGNNANTAGVIIPAPLTVTADSKTMIGGMSIPLLTASYIGFVGGDNTNALSSPAILSTTASSASVAGTYPITATGATDPNYTIQYVNGTLTVISSPQVAITSPKVNGTKQCIVSYPAVAGQTYQLEYTTDLLSKWTSLGTPVSGIDGIVAVTNSISSTPQCFFRVQVLNVQ